MLLAKMCYLMKRVDLKDGAVMLDLAFEFNGCLSICLNESILLHTTLLRSGHALRLLRSLVSIMVCIQFDNVT